MEEQDKVKYQELKERTENVLFDNVKGQIDVSKHRQLIVDIVDTVGKDIEKITDNSADINNKFEEYKESQSELNAKQDIDINKNLQNINQLNDMIKMLSQKDEPIMKAKGGGVVSLPNNAMRSVAPKYRFEGLTLINKATEVIEGGGDFSKDNIYWKQYEDTVKSFSINKDGITVESKDGESSVKIGYYDNIHFDNYYTILRIHSNSNIDKTIFAYSSTESNVSPICKGRYTYYIDKYAPPSGSVHKPVYKFYNSKGLPLKVTLNYMMLIPAEMLEGYSNEEIADTVQGYFEGIKSVQTPMRIKSIGDNILLYKVTGVGVKLVVEDNKRCLHWNAGINGEEFDLGNGLYRKNTPYNLNLMVKSEKDEQWGHPTINIYYSDGTVDKIFMPETEKWSVFKATTNKNKTVTKISGMWNAKQNAWVDVDESSISISKDYEKQHQSLIYFNDEGELRSITNIKDFIENGKLYRNIKRHYFTKEDKWFQDSDYEDDNGNFRYYMVLPFKYKATGDGVEGELVCNNFTPTSNVDNELTERKSNTIAIDKNNSSYLYLTLDKNVDDVNSVIPEGTFIDVILPETEVTNLDISGNVVVHPNGTIFIEPVTNVTAYYNDGLDVSNFNIESVEEFAVFKDGNYQTLDVSKVKIEDNKLTHPDAINGLCYLVFRYDNNPIFGDNEVEYYNNDGILVSPDGTFWKPVLTVDDEGNILMKGEKL